MLSRNSENSPPLLNLKLWQSSNASSQAVSKRLYGRTEYPSEPTSVLDMRSPSPTSTLCCTYGSSTDGIFRENLCDGQLLDCLGLIDSKDGFGWQFQGNEFQVAETDNANGNVNVSLGMEDLENILLEAPCAESNHNNNSHMPCFLGENEYPLQAIKEEGSGLQHNNFNETIGTQFSSEFFAGSSEINPFVCLPNLGDTVGHAISPFALTSSVYPPALNASNISASNSMNPDFGHLQVDEKQHIMYPAIPSSTQNCSQNSHFLPMPAVPHGHMYPLTFPPRQGLPELEKPLQWQQLQQQQEVQLGWRSMIHRNIKDPLLPAVKQEWRELSQKRKACPDQVHEEAMLRQLLSAAEHVETGNIEMAQAILARLNEYASPQRKPLQRATFYFKEALSALLQLHQPQSNSCLSLFELVQKISACKNFSENYPVSQFANFTANQALLEATEGADKIHIIDFEMGLGGQWASFLQEVAIRPGGPPSLRLTAVGLESIEMHLIRENLGSFAENLNIPFEFQVVEVPSNECLTLQMLQLRENETIAVNYSVGMQGLLSKDTISSLLTVIKQLSPKIVVVVDNESGQNGALFSERFVEAFQFYEFLFESLEAVNMNMGTIGMIEKFVLAPRIRNIVAAAYRQQREGERVPHFRSMFMSAGFSPIILSHLTQAQAECLIRRRFLGFSSGFEVVKKQPEQILLLGWQGKPLVSVSVWRCSVV